ncbi:unnamed protein product [Prunus armeniaca]|uniref:Uncharacterized protein n=1 Tax=Prunus armeniaca TaxID=36596 RepID=A0A6J5VPT1_PRUAR|nr:unnamed protein product [Prunus armeniaca]
MSTYDHDKRLMSDSESEFEREPTAFDGESSNDERDTDSETMEFDSFESEGADDEGPKLEIDERGRHVKQTEGVVPLAHISKRTGVGQH